MGTGLAISSSKKLVRVGLSPQTSELDLAVDRGGLGGLADDGEGLALLIGQGLEGLAGRDGGGGTGGGPGGWDRGGLLRQGLRHECTDCEDAQHDREPAAHNRAPFREMAGTAARAAGPANQIVPRQTALAASVHYRSRRRQKAKGGRERGQREEQLADRAASGTRQSEQQRLDSSAPVAWPLGISRRGTRNDNYSNNHNTRAASGPAKWVQPPQRQ